jgi:P-type Mg2+ transporter
MRSTKKREAWQLAIRDVYREFAGSERGLTEAVVQKRLQEDGLNIIYQRNQRGSWNIYLSQFKNPFVLILMAATILSWYLGNDIEALIILAIVILNSCLAFWQDYKAEMAVRDLQKYISHYVRVRRNGAVKEISAQNLVRGDLIQLVTGDIVAADLRVVEAAGLAVDEAILTGESQPVEKTASPCRTVEFRPSALKNMLFAGTSIASGSGLAIVTQIGEQTYLGQTASEMQTMRTETEFQKGLAKFSWVMLRVVVILTLLVFGLNIFLGKDIFESLLFALALAVGITPEVLPMIVTLSLATASTRLVKQKVICKTLPAIENLGKVQILCTDKTGTLTEGTLKVVGWENTAAKTDRQVAWYGLLCTDWQQKGWHSASPIDQALWKEKSLAELIRQAKELPILALNEFDYERRRMGVLVKEKRQNVLVVKGAFEAVLAASSYYLNDGKIKKITKLTTVRLKKSAEKIEANGYRLIAVAKRVMLKDSLAVSDEKELILLGWLKYFDPPKNTVKPSFKKLHDLNVAIKIVSGDSEEINRQVCREVGFDILKNKVISGKQIDRLSDERLREVITSCNVFARIAPRQKARIIQQLRQAGFVVGYMGDGVNDAPALKISDVGISVDSGVDVAKDAADIILLKKSMGVLADGIREGRKTYGNIVKYILNAISGNYGNMFTMIISSLFLPFIPMLPSQILVENLLSDGQFLAIADDNVDEEWLSQPRQWDMKMIVDFMIKFGLLSSIFDLILIGIMFFAWHTFPNMFRTSWFLYSLITEIIVTFAIRTKRNFWRSRPSAWLVRLSVFTVLVAIVLVYSGWGHLWFNFVSPPADVLLLVILVSISYLLIIDILKKGFFRRYNL